MKVVVVPAKVLFWGPSVLLCCSVSFLLVGDDPVGQAPCLRCHILLILFSEELGGFQGQEALAQGASKPWTWVA